MSKEKGHKLEMVIQQLLIQTTLSYLEEIVIWCLLMISMS